MRLTRERYSQGVARRYARSIAGSTALLLSTFIARASFAQQPATAAPGSDSVAVLVTIDADTSDRWQVVTRVRLAADSGDTSRRAAFQYLARPCASVGDVLLDDGATVVSLAARADGAWRALADTLTSARGTRTGFALRYTVTRTAGAVDVPIVIPTFPIPRGANARLGNVQVTVRVPDDRASVTFPRFEHEGSRTWSARLVALPSFVHVRLTDDAARCGETVPRGDDGGLSWRFWLLVAILVVWVPVYQWWALRQSESDT
ncbi:MAG: hypothetical protein IT359_10495 [Gemmatimonadaceae bacterium]|nr:hypothetical protein [Gemmatimonadaceae bacterium]